MTELSRWLGVMGCAVVVASCGGDDAGTSDCQGSGASCVSAACCAPLICISGRVCGEDPGGAPSGGGNTPLPDGGGSSGCANLGESCVASTCCSPLMCIAGRVCGDGPSTPDGGGLAPPTLDAGPVVPTLDAGPTGTCAAALNACDTVPCCPGLDCVASDFGAECRDPNAGGGDN